MNYDLSLRGRMTLQRNHPISVFNGYTARTDVADTYFDSICEWIELLKSGYSWVGPTKVGKSRCVHDCIDRLRREFPNHAFAYISGERDGDRDSQDRFLRACLEQTKKSSRGGGDSLCARFTHFLISQARDAGGNTCVLFVDEMQALRSTQLNFLRNVWNRMAIEGYALLVYPIGNEDLLANAELESDAGKQDNVGRFFVKFARFQGVTNADSLFRILEQFDKTLWFPTPNWPFTRFFAEHAFDRGWRLTEETSLIFDAAKAARGLTALPDNFTGFGMGWITGAIHATLKDALLDPDSHPGAVPIDWRGTFERHARKELLTGLQ